MEKPEEPAGKAVDVKDSADVLRAKFELHATLVAQQDDIAFEDATIVAYGEGIRGLKKRLSV